MLVPVVMALTLSVFPLSVAADEAKAEIDWKKGVISVVGEGAAPESGNAAKKRLMAKRAAMVDGYRKLAEAIHGVRVTSETTVKNFETQDDDIRTEVSGLVKGARVVEDNITDDGGYEVRMEIPMFGENGLAGAVLMSSLNTHKQKLKPADVVSIETEGAPVTPATEVYTGLIVDARNLGAQPAMAPTLQDEDSNEIYVANLPFNEEDIVNQGVASYARNLEEAKKLPRVGDKPLMLRAKRVKGPFHADIVFAKENAKRLVDAAKAGGFLNDLAVVIVY
jgi:hypothetical protein